VGDFVWMLRRLSLGFICGVVGVVTSFLGVLRVLVRCVMGVIGGVVFCVAEAFRCVYSFV
jgi:hypothetical protein